MTDELNIPSLMYDYARNLPPKVITKISPSQIGGCSRAHILKIWQVAELTPTNPGAILNMQTGFMWEQIIKDSLSQAHVPYLYQHKMVDEELNMEGTLDFGIITNGGKELEIWDSKTESSLAARYRKGISYLEAHQDYVDQLNAYAIMAVRQGFKVKKGGFIVIHRDDSFIEQVPFAFEMDKVAATMNKIKYLNHCLKEDILPECDGKYCKIGLCGYGNPNTQAPNSKKKMVNTECCGTVEQIEQWRREANLIKESEK